MMQKATREFLQRLQIRGTNSRFSSLTPRSKCRKKVPHTEKKIPVRDEVGAVDLYRSQNKLQGKEAEWV